MELCTERYWFKGIFEYHVLKGIVDFLKDGAGGKLRVALDEDDIVGGIAIVKTGENAAQLRWFIVRAGYPGLGTGKRLMETAMVFCKERGYKSVCLWTVKTLDTARHLYTRFGFTPPRLHKTPSGQIRPSQRSSGPSGYK